jgi:hypothetical protein
MLAQGGVFSLSHPNRSPLGGGRLGFRRYDGRWLQLAAVLLRAGLHADDLPDGGGRPTGDLAVVRDAHVLRGVHRSPGDPEEGDPAAAIGEPHAGEVLAADRVGPGFYLGDPALDRLQLLLGSVGVSRAAGRRRPRWWPGTSRNGCCSCSPPGELERSPLGESLRGATLGALYNLNRALSTRYVGHCLTYMGLFVKITAF